MSAKQLKRIKPGEIWWIELSIKKNDTVGHETKKIRPCLVIANFPQAKMMTVIPFQSNLKANEIPNTYLIKKNQKNGLRNDSVAIIFQMRSIDYKRFRSYCGILASRYLRNIKLLIKDYLQL